MANGIDYWNSVAAGGTPVATNCPAPLQVVMPSGSDCQTPIRLGPTHASTKITPRIGLERCGKFTLTIDNSNSASEDTTFRLGGDCLHDFSHCPPADDTGPTDMDDSTTLLIGAPNYNGTETNGGAAAAINCYLTAKTIMVSQLKIKGDADNIALFSGVPVTLRDIQPGSNFGSCTADVESNDCGPCFNSSGVQPLVYPLGDLPLGATSSMEIVIPASFVGSFEFCIIGVEENVDITPCGNTPATRCVY